MEIAVETLAAALLGLFTAGYLMLGGAGLVAGFLLGEPAAVAVGLTAEAVLGASMPFALKLMPLYLAVAGAVAGPYLLGREARRRRGGRPEGSR
ncbi:DUF5957 family protein [Streptomyces radiopugnans]|uniref:DUF5957 family protein n=1 Tax=Streptomyces radiopugnans TaxID=403935 RepID=UPI003F1B0F31